ncbi:MAG TPA: DNA-processing protein DprA [Polyangiaceae bacterium]|jgi:DNA processing protein
MATTGTEQRAPRSRYVPPLAVLTLPAGEAGITNGLSLEVPNLYLAGERELLGRAAVAIVGSRKASPDGLRRAAKLARALVESDVVVMSGLAEGIDQAAHRAAIEAGGRTVAVIGTPLDKAYPAAHAALQQEIYERHLLVSPFIPGERTFPSSFPLRNRVMARLSRATVIVEAGDTSGSLHQAAECVKIGRALFIAKSVLETSSATWPARFLGKSGVFVLERVEDLVAEISG